MALAGFKFEKKHPHNGFKKMLGIDNVYRIRIGNYRVLYEIQNEILLIIVIKLGHRQLVYD